MLTGTKETSRVGDAERGVDHHVEQADLGRQELAGARAAALEEELDGEAVAHEPADVGVDDGGVEPVAAEARRMKNAPARRKTGPSGKNERLSPAAMRGTWQVARGRNTNESSR